MVNGIEYKNGVWAEGQFGDTKVTVSIDKVTVDCQNCGHEARIDVWDRSPEGHDACGLVLVRWDCYECSSRVKLVFHDGCIVSMDTIDAQADNEGVGVNSSWDQERVGARAFGEVLGEWWNVEEGRRMTHAEHWAKYHPDDPLPDDEIPF